VSAPWIAAVAALALLGIVNATVLVGLLRRLPTLGHPVGTGSVLGGLPAGSPVPRFDAETASGEPVDDGLLRTGPSVLLFTSPGCEPCETLLDALANGVGFPLDVPVYVVTARSRSGSLPPVPPGVRLLVQPANAVSAAFAVTGTPYLTSIDAGGQLRTGGGVGSVDQIRATADALVQSNHAGGVHQSWT
jgi:hypothetical protein